MTYVKHGSRWFSVGDGGWIILGKKNPDTGMSATIAHGVFAEGCAVIKKGVASPEILKAIEAENKRFAKKKAKP